MGLLNDLENQLERQIPAPLPTGWSQARDDYRPAGPDCQLALPRHHRYACAITTSYGAGRRPIPVFRGTPRRRPIVLN